MVLRGPSQYDCVIIYENLAIEYLEAARDRWGELRVDYPVPNIWNEHPYYITYWTTRLGIELWGTPGVLRLPDEVKEVETAIGAARVTNPRAARL